MRSWPSCSVFLLAIATVGAGCNGPVEEGSPSSSAPAADTGPSFEPASDPGNESEGEDPFFVPSVADAGGTSDTGAPDDPPAPSVSSAQLLATEAARQVSAMKVTAYEHTTFVEESSGTFKYDCSGFLGYALTRSLPTHFAAVRTFAGVSKPLAKHYEGFFATLVEGTKKSGWTRVARAIDLRPGDVVAWLRPVEIVSANTGHVMIVRGNPTVNPKRSDEIIVPITDSSASFHGPTDSRASDGEGLGTGPIGLIVDSKGAPLRYRWSGGYSTKEYSTPITLGRPE